MCSWLPHHGCYIHWFCAVYNGCSRPPVAPDVRLFDRRFNFPQNRLRSFTGIDLSVCWRASPPNDSRSPILVMSGERGGVALSLLSCGSLHDDFPALRVVIGRWRSPARGAGFGKSFKRKWGGEYCQVLGGRADIPRLAQAGHRSRVGRVALEAMSPGGRL